MSYNNKITNKWQQSAMRPCKTKNNNKNMPLSNKKKAKRKTKIKIIQHNEEKLFQYTLYSNFERPNDLSKVSA